MTKSRVWSMCNVRYINISSDNHTFNHDFVYFGAFIHYIKVLIYILYEGICKTIVHFHIKAIVAPVEQQGSNSSSRGAAAAAATTTVIISNYWMYMLAIPFRWVASLHMKWPWVWRIKTKMFVVVARNNHPWKIVALVFEFSRKTILKQHNLLVGVFGVF